MSHLTHTETCQSTKSTNPRCPSRNRSLRQHQQAPFSLISTLALTVFNISNIAHYPAPIPTTAVLSSMNTGRLIINGNNIRSSMAVRAQIDMQNGK